MNKPKPAFQMYAAEFYADTAMLTQAELGALVRIMCQYWRGNTVHGKEAAEGAALGPVTDRLMPHIERELAKLDELRGEYEALSALRSEIGRLGGRPKAKGNQKDSKTKAKGVGVIVGDTDSEKERARESKQRAEESFARFWAVYARKEGKQAAVKAWTRLTDEDRAEAEKMAKSFCAARDPAYLPHPATYLNGRRWEDADPPKPAPKAVNGQPTLMSRAEAMEALRKIRAQHGIPVGGFIEAHLIPDEVNKALR